MEWNEIDNLVLTFDRKERLLIMGLLWYKLVHISKILN